MSLKDKAISIKGKKYVLVSDRVLEFNTLYPQGGITTEIIPSGKVNQIIVKATVRPDDKRVFTAFSQAIDGEGYINKTSALENAETSAVGRALAFMGIGVLDSIASIDELGKANAMSGLKPANPPIKVYKRDETKKQKVKDLCDSFFTDPIALSKKEDYENFVMEKTQLELVPENFDEIIDRLTAIKNEK